MAWTEVSKNRNYLLATTTTALEMAGTAVVVSDTLEHDIGNQNAFLGVNIITVGLDVVADLELEVSHDDTTWFVATPNVIADTTPNVLGEKMAFADLSAIAAPYYRLTFNRAGVDVGDWVLSSYTTVLTGTHNDLVYTAASPAYRGVAGDSITIRYLDPGAPTQTLSVSVTGTAITVNLATNGGSAITSTATEVKTAVDAHAVASTLVTVANSGGDNGTGVVTALAVQSLASGVDTGTIKFVLCASIPRSIASFLAGG